jgi:hypothetical protein
LKAQTTESMAIRVPSPSKYYSDTIVQDLVVRNLHKFVLLTHSRSPSFMKYTPIYCRSGHGTAVFLPL